MAQPRFKLLIVNDRAASPDLPAWTAHERFEAASVACGQAASWLHKNTADALAWHAGTFTDAAPGLVSEWKHERPQMQIVVVLDRPPAPRDLVALMHAGCHDVFDAASPETLRTAPELLLERIEFVRTRRLERLKLKQNMQYAGLVGASPEMLHVYEQLRHAAARRAPVLIHGETGTGKGLVAHAIHALGERNGKPFVTVDCACLAPTLIESELYGVTRGAFTGAVADRAGLVQSAQTGTLFLDEVGELPLEMQPKLLRLLEEGEVRRLGSPHSQSVDVRTISATTQDLDALVADRRFRVELYYRLAVLHIELPPLRLRRHDIPLLAAHFASRHLFRNEPITVTEGAMDVLRQYFWPGNVRELKNAIEAAVPTLTRNSIHVHNLPRRVTEGVRVSSDDEGPACADEALNLKRLEQKAIVQALRHTRNDKTKAARLLGIGKTTLYRKLKQMGSEAAGEQNEPAADPSDRPYVM